MKTLKVLPFLIVILNIQVVRGQDSMYVKPYHDDILIKSLLNNRSLDLNMSPIESIGPMDKTILYRPNVQNAIGLQALYKHFGLGVRFRLNDHPSASEPEGRRNSQSKYFDLQMHSYGKTFGYDVYYQDYQGYFINDADDIFNSSLNGKRTPRRDDLRLRNFTANLFYNFNSDKFSYRAAFVHDEQQLKSAGAFILTGSLGYLRISGDSSFIPPNAKFGFKPKAFYSETDFYTISVTPGYAHTFVLPANFYVSASASGLIGLQYFRASSERLSNDGFDKFIKGILRAAVGYNSKRWMVGAVSSADIQDLSTDVVKYRTVNWDTSIFIAYRIHTNLMKNYDSFFDLLKRKKKR